MLAREIDRPTPRPRDGRAHHDHDRRLRSEREEDPRARAQADPGRRVRASRARGQGAAGPRVHLDVPRHGRPRARPARPHAPPPGRSGRGALAAEAAPRRGSSRARAGRAAGAASAGALVAARRVPPRPRAAPRRPPSHPQGGRPGRRGGDRRRRRVASRGPARHAALPRARDRARRRRRAHAPVARAGARAGRRDAEPGSAPEALPGARSPPPAVSEPSRDAGPLDTLGHALAEQARRLLLHDPGTRLGSDPEELHQLRVATRRLRAFLRAGRELVDASWAASLRDELGWLGRALGPARDLDVLLERLTADAEALGDETVPAALLATLEEERVEARAVVVDALSSDRYLALLDRLDAVAEPPPSGVETPLAEVWRREWRRTRRVLDRLDGDSPDAELHAGRIRVKRARYAAELASPALGKRGRAFVDAAKALQDVLGEHQDATVAEARLREWATGGGDANAASRLLAREDEQKAAARAAWPSAWKALRRAATPLS
ncbi:MAG: CHAD domain-containing protein [Gaiella sp.]|nr:CHAD domain-containing protein [Gaiella sp.]